MTQDKCVKKVPPFGSKLSNNCKHLPELFVKGNGAKKKEKWKNAESLVGFILSAVNDVRWWHIFSLQNWLFDMIRGEESDTFGPFQIVASAHPSGLLCWASPADRNVRLRLKNRLATASKRWLEIHVYARQQRAESRPDCPANRDAAAGLAYIFLRRSIPSFTWLQAVTLAALLAALSAKDRVFTWCAAVQRPGPPQWNWNVNAYWAAVNTCNPAGPWGGIRKAEEIETTQGGPLSTEVSCLCVHGVNSSAASTPNITLPPAPPPPPRTVIILSAAKASSAPNPPQLHPSVQSFDFWKRYLLVMWPCCCCLLGGGFSHNVFFLPENRTFPPSSVMKSWNRDGRRPRIRSPFSLFQADQWPSSLNIPTAPSLWAPT